jgi:DNA replication protein DnaC
MKALKLYSKFYKKLKAMEEILKDLHPLALRELRKQPEGKADYDGVEFHLTKKVEKKYDEYVDAELKEMREKINKLKEEAEKNGKVIYNEKETFDASIPRSAKKNVLSSVVEYRKYFSIDI